MLGLLLGGVFGSISTYVRSQYSKSDSWIVPSAHADIQPYTWDPGLCGDGCGGCSGGDSSDSCSGS
jgi:hypothetical protein